MKPLSYKLMFKTTLALLVSAAAMMAQPIATGLRTPQKFILTPRGNFLVSEPAGDANAGRISFVGRAGQIRAFIDGLPSGIDVVNSPSGPTALELRDRTLYVVMGIGDTERPGAAQGQPSVHNPAGPSSQLFSSILEFRFSADVDTIGGTFNLSAANRQTLADGGEAQISDGQGSTATVSVLANFADATPDAPQQPYRFSNPWGLSLTPDGKTLYMVDASGDSLFRIDTATGRYRRVIRFPRFPNPLPFGPPMVDAVPTGVRVFGERVLVSFLTGFPFAAYNARVISVDPNTGTTDLFIHGLTSTTDVLTRYKANGALQVFVLQFSTNQIANPPGPSQVIQYDSPEGKVIAGDLAAGVSLAFDASTSDLFVLELTGRIVRVHID